MTAEHIHDALTLLPADLITETDAKRSRKDRVVAWKRYAAMAACFALVLCSGLLCLHLFGNMGRSAAETAEAPMLQAAENGSGIAVISETEAAAPVYEEAAPETPAEDPLSTPPTTPNSTSTTNGDLCIDHAHNPAETPRTVTDPVTGWCGNTTATLHINGEAHVLAGSDAIALTDILINLDYSPEELCRCAAEYTADTEMSSGYEISLTQYFVRYNGGQAPLTAQQAETLAQLIGSLGE